MSLSDHIALTSQLIRAGPFHLPTGGLVTALAVCLVYRTGHHRIWYAVVSL